MVQAYGDQDQYIVHVTHGNRKSYIFCSSLQNTSIMQDQECRQPSQKHMSWFNNRQVTQITYAALYKHWHYFSVTLHSCVSTCIHMYTLFPINTNSLISFHKQYSVLLCQGTTFKELLSLVFYRKRAELNKVTLTFTFMHQVSLTFEDADILSAECN